jgi:hypothetical protein
MHRNRSGGLFLAMALLGTAPTAGAQNAQPAVAPLPVEEPIPVDADAPPGTSRNLAIGSGIGALIGLVAVAFLVASVN